MGDMSSGHNTEGGCGCRAYLSVRPPPRQLGSCPPWHMPGHWMKHHPPDVPAYITGWQLSQACDLEDMQETAGHQSDPDMPLRGHQPQWGINPCVAISRALAAEQNQEIGYSETKHEQSRGEDQQLGRTKQRERRGSTGRAGPSKAGKRLAIRFLIDGLLLCCSLGHYRHQPHRRGDMVLI
jgi:hypothetical protein